jgi:hypothetical protein
MRFYAIGDFGYPSPEMKRVAAAMQLYSEINGPPDFILGLGDNFYPSGVDSVKDRQFQTSWEDVFLRYQSLRVPWHISKFLFSSLNHKSLLLPSLGKPRLHGISQSTNCIYYLLSQS